MAEREPETGPGRAQAPDEGFAQWLLAQAARCGADGAEVLALSGESIEAGVRLGEVETLRSARQRRVGLRVFVGKSSATLSTSEFDRNALEQFAAQAVALARLSAADCYAGLPARADHSQVDADLGLCDREHGVPDIERALAIAHQVERAGRAEDARICNSEGAGFEASRYELLFANSQGFSGRYTATTYGVSAALIAGDADAMQRGYWYAAARRLDELEPEAVGRTAARRAVRRLGARRVKTTQAAVVFEAETAATLMRSLAAAASGPALYRESSFLLGALGKTIAAPKLTIIDDGALKGRLGSRPFDGDGLAPKRKYLVRDGVLESYLLDTYAARRLGLRSTGNATRAVGEAPSAGPSNLCLQPGTVTLEQMISAVRRGLLVTELMGSGVNLATGDYSRGAAGIWIENGELAYPVHEITIAGNLSRMLRDVEAVGSELAWRSNVAAAPIRIAEMTIAGE